MSQYKAGSVSVNNGSQVVTGTGTAWLSNIQPGDGFTVAGTQVPYTVGSVDSDSQITLSAPYAGASGAGLAYTIWRDFTSNANLPELYQGDIETPTLWTRAMRKIDALIGAATTTTRGTVEQATTQEAKDAVAGKFPDAAGVHSVLHRFGLGTDTIPTITDFDAPIETGDYKAGSSAAHAPPDWGGGVVKAIYRDGGDFSSQIASSVTSGRIHARIRNLGGWSDWLEVYTQGSILGPVSQSGGVPTGALFESGENANGSWVKHPNGWVEIDMNPIIDYSLDSTNTQIFSLPIGIASSASALISFYRLSLDHSTNNLFAKSATTLMTRAENSTLKVWVTETYPSTANIVSFKIIARWY